MKTKKRNTKNVIFCAVLIIATALTYVGCPQFISLGSSIDILPPGGEIQYPDAGGTPIRGSFVMKGSALDDEGVKAVSVLFQNIETKAKTRSYDGNLTVTSATSAAWTININNEVIGKEENHPLVEKRPIPDGEYTAIVTVTDNTGRTSQITKNYKIDNTPPVFIIQRPSTLALPAASVDNADPYGAVFFVIGQAEDKNTIEELTLKVKDSDISISKKFVGKNIKEELASASVDAHGEYTDPLYRYNDQNGKPKIKALVSLTDNARIFSGTGEQGRGNTSKWYYLKDKTFREKVLKEGYTEGVINDYLAGKKGSAFSLKRSDRLLASLYNPENAQGQTVKGILENSRIITEGDTGASEKHSVFTLNPNRSPGFQVTGVTNLPKTLPGTTPPSDIPSHSVQFFATNTLPTLLVDLVCNTDKDRLVESLNLQAYKESGIAVNLYKCNPVSYIDSGNQKKLQFEPADTPAYSLKFADLTYEDETNQVVSGSLEKLTVRWALPSGLAEGYYVVRTEGKDSEGNSFVAHNNRGLPGGVFVVQFAFAGNKPIIVPAAPLGYVKGDFYVRANVSSLGTGEKVYYKIDGPASGSDGELTLSSGTEYKTSASVPLSSVGAQGKHTVHFMATDAAHEPVRTQIDFYKDTEAPKVELSYPDPESAQAGLITVRGEVSDEFSGVKTESTKYIIGKKTPAPTADSAGWQDMNKSSLVWEFTYNLDSLTPSTDGTQVSGQPSVYDIPVYILTEDKIGNKGVTEKSIRFDSDGTKPIVKILSPHHDQILGGTIQIFGTASVRSGNPSDIGDVNIQIAACNSSAIPDFNTGSSGVFTFGSKDYYNSGQGQALTGLGGTCGAAWQVSINENGEFNNPSTDPSVQNWDVYFRLRAKNTNSASQKWGEWSQPVKITIDKAYPTIGSPVPLKVEDSAASGGAENYTSDMWITSGKKLSGSLFDEAGIKALTISSPQLLGTQVYNLQQALSNGWIEEDTAHAPNPPTGAKNYTLKIPLNIDTLNESLKRKGELGIKIKIVENTPKELYSEETVNFHFDITKPSGDVGEFLYRYTGEFEKTSVSDSMLAQKIKDSASGTDYSRFALLVGNTVVNVQGVSGDVVSFTPQLAAAASYHCLLYKKPHVIYKGVGNWIVRGVANDEGSGVTRIETWVTVNATQTPHLTVDSNKITKQLGGQVYWESELDLSPLPDGKGSLHCKISDARGNEYSISPLEVLVKNKPIKVTKITLSTDIGGSAQSFTNDTTNNALVTAQNANRDYTGTFKSTNFAFKNTENSKIKVDFTGGEGTIQYKLTKSDGSVLQDLTGITSGAEIDLKDHIGSGSNKIGNSGGTPTTVQLELWDSAYGLSPGTTSAFAKIDIQTLFDALDEKKPTVVILPFHWNGEDDNSLYEKKRKNGHVEIAKIQALGNDHSSVSGKVVLRGFAYDNIKIDKLTATVPNNSSLTVKATRSGQTWTSDKHMTAHGAELKVETLAADYSGYYVKWELAWDSSKTSVGLAKNIQMSAHDGGSASNNGESVETEGENLPSQTIAQRVSLKTAEHASFSGAAKGCFIVFNDGEKQYLTRVKSKSGSTLVLNDDVPLSATSALLYGYEAGKTKTSVNVVPYITGIETPLRNESGLSANTIRSSSGKYSVIKGASAGFITVKGFNLTGAEARLVKTSEMPAATLITGGPISVAGVSSSSFEVGNDLPHSGYMEVFAGSSGTKQRAVNNINDDTKPYNKEEDLHVLKNKTLTDNRYLRVFDMKETTVRNGYYPEMVMENNNPVFGYLDTSGWANAPSNEYMPTTAHPQRAKFNDTDGTAISTEYLIKGLAWDQMGMARDADGRYFHLTSYDYAGQKMSFIYDRYAQVHSTSTWSHNAHTYKGTGWGTIIGYTGYNSDYSHNTNNNALTLEGTSFEGKLLLGRYQYPKIIAKGNSKTDKAVVYIAYYDANTVKKEIVFRNFQLGKTVSGTPTALFSGAGSSTGEPYEQKVNFTEDTDPYGQVYSTGRLPAAESATQYFDMGVTNDNHVVIVYFDESAGKLKLRYSENAVNGDNPTASVSWKDSSVDFPSYVGTYVSMDIDTRGGIHIAAFDSSDSDLIYLYLSAYSSTDLKKAKVDAAFSVGQWTQIKVHTNKPYIAYYNNSEAGQRSAIKLAVAQNEAGTVKDGVDTSGFVTGCWECMTVPTKKPAQGGTPKFKKVNLGFDSAGTPVLGYLGANIEFGKWLNE